MFGHKPYLVMKQPNLVNRSSFLVPYSLFIIKRQRVGATIEPIMVLGNFNMKQKALLLFGKPSCESSSCHAKQRPEEAKEGRWGNLKASRVEIELYCITQKMFPHSEKQACKSRCFSFLLCFLLIKLNSFHVIKIVKLKK